MFQATRRRLALWYTALTAVLLLLFASGFFFYVRNTLVERIDDTLNHVVEVVQRSLVIESTAPGALPQVNLEASLGRNVQAVEDDHIDLEWFDASGELLWSTFSVPPGIALHPHQDGETVHWMDDQMDDQMDNQIDDQWLRQVTQEIQRDGQPLGYLRVSHPWFEVTKPIRQLLRDLSLGMGVMVAAIAAIGWFLSGLAIAPVRDSYQRLKQFTADASHELRNPIAVIQTNVQVALEDPDPHLQQDQLRVVERLTRRLGRLVDDLLFLARQDSGIAPRQTELVPFNDLLQEVMEEQQAIATEKFLSLLLHLDETANYGVMGDRNQLTRLLTNLISNAIYYTPTGGKIEVTLQRLKSPSTQQLQLRIQDTGIGIPAEALPQLFDRFYRVDPARKNAPDQSNVSPNAIGENRTGSGLGLAIAKVIVENHQGQIQVESTLHQGTLFTVHLPIHKSP
ncbi:MAG: HAMP domain-containing histidine kinase [Oculatellaceae cyanobacterium Prado106]|nr:HAMP domain-containing histidine kinase [Oculatellaceae cyanobacterium Prado106]